MQKYVLDTSFLSALINQNDIHHERALDTYKALAEESYFIISSIVIVELITGIKRFSPRKIEALIDLCFKISDRVDYIDMGFLKDFIDFAQNTKRLITPIDNIIICNAIKEDADIISFDRQLIKVYSESIK